MTDSKAPEMASFYVVDRRGDPYRILAARMISDGGDVTLFDSHGTVVAHFVGVVSASAVSAVQACVQPVRDSVAISAVAARRPLIGVAAAVLLASLSALGLLVLKGSTLFGFSF